MICWAMRHQEVAGHYENKTKGDYVVQLKGPYDIALNKQADGTFGAYVVSSRWGGPLASMERSQTQYA